MRQREGGESRGEEGIGRPPSPSAGDTPQYILGQKQLFRSRAGPSQAPAAEEQVRVLVL